MILLLCLTAILAVCQAARIPRGTEHLFPNFHSVHHGDGATSYQNVQIESYGSVPIPTDKHIQIDHHLEPKQHHVIQLQEQPHYVHQEEHHEVVTVDASPEIDHRQHLQQYIILEKVPSSNAIPIVESNHDNLQHYITLQPKAHEVQADEISHENGQHYITLQAVHIPYPHNEIQNVELHDPSQSHYYGDNYEQQDREYEYH